jgi:hypothetical protein
MLLGKYDGRWKIVEILWQRHPPKGTTTQQAGEVDAYRAADFTRRKPRFEVPLVTSDFPRLPTR